MQKLWTICLSLMMGISFVASYPAALVEAPAMKTPDESLEAIKAKAFMDPLDQLVQSFPNDFNTCRRRLRSRLPLSRMLLLPKPPHLISAVKRPRLPSRLSLRKPPAIPQSPLYPLIPTTL